MSALWYILGSVVFVSSCYQLFKLFLIKWICRCFLSNSVALKCDQPKLEQVSSSLASHHGEKKLVTDGDVAAISVEVVAIFIGAFIGTMAVYVMYETRHDTLYSRSSVIDSICHIGAWYLIGDFYNMYDAYYVKYEISHLPMIQKLYSFCKARWAYVLHHCFMFFLCYPIVISSIRNHKGDFYVGSIIIEELTNPLLSGAKALRLLGQEKSPIYIVNGYMIVLTFFVLRILNLPADVVVYAAQYHDWNILKALLHLRWICCVTSVTMLSFQVYWFIAIVKLALRQREATRKSLIKDKVN